MECRPRLAAELSWIKAELHAGHTLCRRGGERPLPNGANPCADYEIARRSPMMGPRNHVVQVSRFGDPKGLEVVDAPLPTAGRGEVRVRVLASSLNYTEVLIRRHLYPQTMRLRPPFVMGYDVVGDIDQLGEGVRDLQIGDRVADMTVVGSNADY